MVRKATTNDKAKYIKMATTFYNSNATAHPVPLDFITETFDTLLSCNIYGDIFVYEENNELLGYLLTAKSWSQEGGGVVCWIEEIYIENDHRGKGIGTKMLRYVLENIVAERFRLEVEPENLGAVKLYKSLGFEFMDYNSMVKEVRYK